MLRNHLRRILGRNRRHFRNLNRNRLRLNNLNRSRSSWGERTQRADKRRRLTVRRNKILTISVERLKDTTRILLIVESVDIAPVIDGMAVAVRIVENTVDPIELMRELSNGMAAKLTHWLLWL